MTRVYAGLGSNIDKEINIPAGIKAVASHFSPLDISTIYESEPLGFSGDNFYNLVLGFDTDLSELDVIRIFKGIEFSYGREEVNSQKNSYGKSSQGKNEQQSTSRTLDVDLLLFGDLVRHDEDVNVPREDILQFPFVLCPLAEIAGDLQHPETGKRLGDMWCAFDQEKHQIKPVNL